MRLAGAGRIECTDFIRASALGSRWLVFFGNGNGARTGRRSELGKQRGRPPEWNRPSHKETHMMAASAAVTALPLP